MSTRDERDGGLEVQRQCDDCFTVYTRFRWPSVHWVEFLRCAECAAKRWVLECTRRARLLH